MPVDRRAARELARLCRVFEGDYHYPAGLFHQAADMIDALLDEVERLERTKGDLHDVSTVSESDDREPGA